jgi:hypothetical protein
MFILYCYGIYGIYETYKDAQVQRNELIKMGHDENAMSIETNY